MGSWEVGFLTSRSYFHTICLDNGGSYVNSGVQDVLKLLSWVSRRMFVTC